MQIIDINGNKRDCIEIFIDKKWPDQVSVIFESKIRKGEKHTEWFPMEDFIKFNPQMKNLIMGKGHEVAEDLGVVSSSGAKLIKDGKKNWQQNVFVGFPLWISRGTGEGQIRAIVENNHNTLFVDKDWKIQPDNTSQYVISYNVHNPKVLGNNLPGVLSKSLSGRKK